MKAFINQISLGNWLTLIAVFGGFTLQWGAFASRLADHDIAIRENSIAISELKEKSSAIYPAAEAHKEQRVTDSKLSEIRQDVSGIKVDLLNIKGTLLRIEQQTKP